MFSVLSSLIPTFTPGFLQEWCYPPLAVLPRVGPFTLYLVIEGTFFLVFTYYIVPRSNRRTEPRPYRDYGRDRHKLLIRIVERIERTCRDRDVAFRPALEDFIREWFGHSDQSFSTEHLPILKLESRTSSFSSVGTPSSSAAEGKEFSDGEEATKWPTRSEPSRVGGRRGNSGSEDEFWSVDFLGRDDMGDFLAWAFFGKYPHELNSEWERDEFDKLFELLASRTGLTFRPGRSPTVTPRRLTLDDGNPLHRPLLIYFIISVLALIGRTVLRFAGFRRYVASQSGLVYWYRPSKAMQPGQHEGRQDDPPQLWPLLFFHGIAPAGLTFYLPMVLRVLCGDGRAAFLFENRPVSYSICFQALTEEETVAGVVEAVDKHLGPDAEVCLCGHSFGSCQLTWLLHAPEVRRRIRQFVLIDPVTIMLSEPDVMMNFLYGRCGLQEIEGVASTQKSLSLSSAGIGEFIRRNKIRLVASSELFIEHYLRRHFSWYNSELWLEDIPTHVEVAVFLSEDDEIIDATKVKQEVEMHNRALIGNSSKIVHRSAQVRMLAWEGGHAHCITSSPRWTEVKNVLIAQERAVAKED